jgi:hypothetical protein
MTSRNDMDRPATVLSASLGVVLIAVSILLFVFVGGSAAKSYTVTWNQAEAGRSQPAAFASAAGTQAQTTPFTVHGDLSNVTVLMESCNDNRGAGNVAPAAAITWELFKDNASYKTGTAQCTAGDAYAFALHMHPDVGSVKAKSAPGAQDAVWAGHTNQTHTFYLKFQYARGGNTNGLPIPGVQPTFSGRMQVTVDKWVSAVNEPAEASK